MSSTTVTVRVMENRHKPDAQHAMADITLIVRPPGNPFAIKVFTDEDRAEAELYAAEHEAVVETLPFTDNSRAPRPSGQGD